MTPNLRTLVRLACGVALACCGCGGGDDPVPLGPDEEALVHAYVRIAVLQALHARAPDSTAAALPQLRASVDTAAVQRALAALAQDPLRWELVHRAIASRLEELEASPSSWWSVVRGDSLPAALPAAAPEAAPVRRPSAATNAADR
jgi:hypothetical protein